MEDVAPPLPAQPKRFMDRLRAFMRARHLAYRTEKTYCLWIRDFIRFSGRRHPESMGPKDVDTWLSYLANERNVSINTQKTALNAVVFMYQQFLQIELGSLQFQKTSCGRKLPAVFTHDEAMAVLNNMRGVHYMLSALMYGAGLRVMEAVRLRVQDIDFSEG
ncbi:phage integrase N-terminal SAM-like domain-containing protein [Marinobacter fonticola]|uniref:phage integrase N-terminal SAM-like domain-containing protein n=1 Tax=Marinobacter fonticola TaxID=2603215 RepID=UPI0038732019